MPSVPSSALRSRSGFTLIEILLVLALLGLISTAIIAGANAIDRLQREDRDAESIALKAIASARHAAVTGDRIVLLRHDTEGNRLVWSDGSIALPDNGETVDFLPPKLESAYLIGGRLQENALPAVHFYPDGTCDAFRLQIRRQQDSRESVVDPWTCSTVDLAAK